MHSLTDCTNCPLKGETPVPCSLPARPEGAIVGEAPGRTEELEMEPFVGASGRLLNSALERAGEDREGMLVTNAVSCRPKRKLKPKEWAQAIACCKPRLEYELSQMEGGDIRALGGKALQALTGKANIMAWVGGCLETQYGHVLPLPHPAFCLRKPAWIPVFKRWMLRHSRDYTAWTWPNLLTEGSCEAQIAALRRLYDSPLPLTIDVENDRETGALELVGVGNTEEVVVIEWPIEGRGPLSLLAASLTSLLASNKPKIMQNGQHDILVLEKHGFTVNGFTFDTLLAHAVVAPQLPHNLGLIAACELIAPRWKSKITDFKLYNAQDVGGTACLEAPLQAALDNTHNGNELFKEAMALNEIAIKMRRRGVKIDPVRLGKHRGKLWQRLARAKDDFASMAPGVNLGAAGQTNALKDFFFEDLKCKPLRYTDEGEPSLDALTLESYCSTQVAPVAQAVLAYRRAAKLLSTYVDGLPVNKDNEIHAVWKTYGTVTGRWSSAEPNCQNIPKAMRDIFISRPGTVIVSADFSQLELRIAALLAGCGALLDSFGRGEDVHEMVGLRLLGTREAARRYRTQVKNFEYGAIYGGDPVTLWKNMVVKAPDTRLPMVRKMHKQFFKEFPEMRTMQMRFLKEAEANKYVEEAVSGRREYFHDGLVDYNKTLNFPIQACAGTIMNRAIRAVDKEIKWNDGEAILFQVHDELNIEVADPERGAEILRKAMTQEVELAGQRVSFPIDVSFGKDWYNLEEM